MKKILIATALVAGMTFAAGGPMGKTAPVGPKFDTTKVDSLFSAHKVKVDSLFSDLRKALPDSLKGRLDTAAKAWKLADVDTGKGKVKVDSLKKYFSGKRDTLISKIKDTATQTKIKARIATLEGDRAALKTKLDARKAEIDAKIADIKKTKK